MGEGPEVRGVKKEGFWTWRHRGSMDRVLSRETIYQNVFPVGGGVGDGG